MTAVSRIPILMRDGEFITLKEAVHPTDHVTLSISV